MSRKKVDWSRYAKTYDLLLQYNPAYGEIIRKFTDTLHSWPLEQGSIIVDVGAGTGNFSIAAARNCPGSMVYHVEPDLNMNRVAQSKADCGHARNLRLIQNSAEAVDFAAGSIDAVVMVHSLYCMTNRENVLSKAATWLKDGGHLFLCDLGRPMDVSDWRQYMLKQLIDRYGYLFALKIALKGREMAKQNRIIRQKQDAGDYWLHDQDDLILAVGRTGLMITASQELYRGYSDLVVAEK